MNKQTKIDSQTQTTDWWLPYGRRVQGRVKQVKGKELV